jgi:hypothetical protein
MPLMQSRDATQAPEATPRSSVASREAAPSGNAETRTEKGISLARGPALVLGTILLAAGLYFIYKAHYFPKLSNFPDGEAPVDTKVFGIFGANGWTGMLTAVAGGLLLFGAAQHLLAKTMSLIVGVGLGAAAIIAAVSGNVLGLAAANGWTELAWGIAAAILLLNTLVPRRRRTVPVDNAPAANAPVDDASTEPAARRDARYTQPVDSTSRTTSTAGARAGNGTAGDPVVSRDRTYAGDTVEERDAEDE